MQKLKGALALFFVFFKRAGDAEEERSQVVNCLGFIRLVGLVGCLLTLEISKLFSWVFDMQKKPKKGEKNRGQNVAFTFACSRQRCHIP